MHRRLALGVCFALVAVILLLFINARRGNEEDPGFLPVTGSVGGEEAVRPRDVVTVLDRCERRSDSLHAVGWVHNDLDLTVRYVEVVMTWEDPEGRNVGMDYLAVVGAETLMPGDSASFSMVTIDSLAVGCRAGVFAYDPIF